jgi:hypothetical protein
VRPGEWVSGIAVAGKKGIEFRCGAMVVRASSLWARVSELRGAGTGIISEFGN